ncbi:hypothetical protein SISSUDRAFT_419469 [Sistotremastrum suecicum HHB10207 ss-3]|uniref:Uncharacterized protein n=1 Tax=Sistotremastrum suecicum HHB10207 ss-3 TaxID=1314776 RepID=A0A165YLI5_9AGAM|nr:hypothetical protein SISSUDRAFT_419469 [Sistotremastrum suecicum HHB10207 ss-3]
MKDVTRPSSVRSSPVANPVFPSRRIILPLLTSVLHSPRYVLHFLVLSMRFFPASRCAYSGCQSPFWKNDHDLISWHTVVALFFLSWRLLTEESDPSFSDVRHTLNLRILTRLGRKQAWDDYLERLTRVSLLVAVLASFSSVGDASFVSYPHSRTEFNDRRSTSCTTRLMICFLISDKMTSRNSETQLPL